MFDDVALAAAQLALQCVGRCWPVLDKFLLLRTVGRFQSQSLPRSPEWHETCYDLVTGVRPEACSVVIGGKRSRNGACLDGQRCYGAAFAALPKLGRLRRMRVICTKMVHSARSVHKIGSQERES
jgi:hypothetical protein